MLCQIDLKGYQQFPNPISLDEFVEHNRSAIEEELRNGCTKGVPFSYFVRRERSSSCAGCLPYTLHSKLYGLIRAAVFDRSPAAPERTPTPIQPIYTVSDFSAESGANGIIEIWRSRLERRKSISSSKVRPEPAKHTSRSG